MSKKRTEKKRENHLSAINQEIRAKNQQAKEMNELGEGQQAKGIKIDRGQNNIKRFFLSSVIIA